MLGSQKKFSQNKIITKIVFTSNLQILYFMSQECVLFCEFMYYKFHVILNCT